MGSTDTHIPDSDIAALVSIATRFAGRVRMAGPLDFALPPTHEPGLLADACANALVIDPGERQRVLETTRRVPTGYGSAASFVAVQEVLLAPRVLRFTDSAAAKSERHKAGKGPPHPLSSYRCSLPVLAGFEARCWRTHRGEQLRGPGPCPPQGPMPARPGSTTRAAGINFITVSAPARSLPGRLLTALSFVASAALVAALVHHGLRAPYWLGVLALVPLGWFTWRWLERRRVRRMMLTGQTDKLMHAWGEALERMPNADTTLPLLQATALAASGLTDRARASLAKASRGSAWQAAYEHRLLLETLLDSFEGDRSLPS